MGRYDVTLNHHPIYLLLVWHGHDPINVCERESVYVHTLPTYRQATGVSDVNEVIQKIISQESTAQNLMMLTKENQVNQACYGFPHTRAHV